MDLGAGMDTLRSLIRDRDSKYILAFDGVFDAEGIQTVKTPPRAPRANAICERFVGSLRRECLDHVLVIGVLQLVRILKEYSSYFNHSRPHQGIGQRIPEVVPSPPAKPKAGKLIAIPVLNGLHHDYRLAA